MTVWDMALLLREFIVLCAGQSSAVFSYANYVPKEKFKEKRAFLPAFCPYVLFAANFIGGVLRNSVRDKKKVGIPLRGGEAC